METNPIVFLHVPHTAGRAIKRYFWLNDIKIHNIHNDKDISTFKIDNTIKYFVLRNPVERIIGEYIHYSGNLNRNGEVNYLSIDQILKIKKDFDLTNPFHYINLELTRNLYCKFLLHKSNWNIPITDNDFDELNKLLNTGIIVFDHYKKSIELPRLSNLTGIDINELNNSMNEANKIAQRVNNDTKKNEYMNNQLLIKEIEVLNKYDIMLYNLLKDQ